MNILNSGICTDKNQFFFNDLVYIVFIFLNVLVIETCILVHHFTMTV